MKNDIFALIARKINDYLVKVKANQPKLYKAIEAQSKQQKPREIVRLSEG